MTPKFFEEARCSVDWPLNWVGWICLHDYIPVVRLGQGYATGHVVVLHSVSHQEARDISFSHYW